MPDFRQTVTSPIAQGTTAEIQLVLTDETDTPIPGSALASCTLTLTERRTGTILNGRNNSTILGAGGGSVDETGLLTLTLAPADTALLDPTDRVEHHVALIAWTWSAGTKRGKKRITYPVIQSA